MSDMITRSIIVKSNVDKTYKAWENFDNFPMFMENIQSVRMIGPDKSHWVMKGPLGKELEWDAYTTLKEQNKRIGWSTKENEGDVTTSGQVSFNPLPNNETQITVMLQYIPRAGIVGDVVAKLFANPEERLEKDLQNFKNYVEKLP